MLLVPSGAASRAGQPSRRGRTQRWTSAWWLGGRRRLPCRSHSKGCHLVEGSWQMPREGWLRHIPHHRLPVGSTAIPCCHSCKKQNIMVTKHNDIFSFFIPVLLKRLWGCVILTNATKQMSYLVCWLDIFKGKFCAKQLCNCVPMMARLFQYICMC